MKTPAATLPLPDPADAVPPSEAIQASIRDHVYRLDVLRRLLTVARRRERLGLAPVTALIGKEVRS